MEKYLMSPFYQTNEFQVSPSIAFDACGMRGMDAAAEQYLQRRAARNVSGGENYTLPALLDSEPRANT
jgi:hypothetical protein